MLSCTNRKKLLRITNISSKIIGLSTPNLLALIDTAIIRRANTVKKKILVIPLISNLICHVFDLLNATCYTTKPQKSPIWEEKNKNHKSMAIVL